MKGALAGALGGALLLLGGAAPAQEGGTFGPGLRYRNKGAGFEIGVTGYAQVDYIDFLNWQSLDESQPLESPDWNLTRLRVGLEGEWRRLSWEIQGDFGDVANFTDDLVVERRRDIWLNYRFAKPFELRAGHFKVPVGLEWLTSARRIDFIERSLPSRNLAPSRDWGVAAHGEAGRVEYTVGVFQGDDSYSFRTTGTTGAGRLVVKLGDLELGGSFAQGRVVAEEEVPGTLPQPRGQEGQAVSSFEFFKRKYVDGTRRYVGADFAFLRGPFGLKGEYLEQREERLGQGPNFEDLPAVKGKGWAASATWLVTGDKKRRTIRPDRPVFQGPGAVELSFRYDEVRYDDVGPDEGFAGVGDRSRNVRPAADRAFTGGISWWPRAFLRLVGNVVQERFEDPLLAPEPGREGNYVTVIVRFQIELP